jgi:hypothetical protein
MDKLSLIFIITTILLLGCNPKCENDKFIADLPDSNKVHQPNLFYEVKKKLTDELNLEKLEVGVDSFELRLWTKIEPANLGYVFVIKKQNLNWTCIKYAFTTLHNSEITSGPVLTFLTDIRIDSFYVWKEQPKSGWTKFFGDLKKSNIYDLRDQHEIKNWESKIDDGTTYLIEYANKEKYRFYSYSNPSAYKDKYIECRQMTNILNIFNLEIGLEDPLEKYR